MIIPCYPEFNIYSSIASNTTALGPVMIATIVNMLPGWEVEIIDENNYKRGGLRDAEGKPAHNLLQQIRAADVIGLYGGLTSTIPRLYEIAALYKELNVPVIAGGQHFLEDNIQEALDNNIDCVLIGEGEETVKELFESFCSGKSLKDIQSIAFHSGEDIIKTPLRSPIANLSNLPLPDFSLLRYAKITLFPVSWTRGCGMHCEFCTVKGKVRYGTVDYAFRQFTSAYERFGGKDFFIVDDLFGQKREMAIELCYRLRDYQKLLDVRFWISSQIRLDMADDTELLSAMRAAGIKLVAIGYESPVPAELESMNKKLKPEEMVNLTNSFRRMGFLVHGMFIFAYPSKADQKFTLNARERTKIFSSFIRKAGIDTIQILLPVPLPGTKMTQRLEKEKRILPRDVIGWEYYDGNFPLFIPDKPLITRDLYLSHKALMSGFYSVRHFFALILCIICFPLIIFNLRHGWSSWYATWQRNLWRFLGWIILRKWSLNLAKNNFPVQLGLAEKKLTCLLKENN